LAGGDGAEVAATTGLRIARFAAAAQGVVGHGFTRIRRVVAGIGRARNAVITRRRHTWPAAIGCAGLRAIAELSVIAHEILARVRTRAEGLNAFIVCAGDAVIAIDVGWIGAAEIDVAQFDAIALKAVIADGVVRGMVTSACLRVARIDGARNGVVAILGGTGDAIDAVACFDAVACIAVVALRVHRARHGRNAAERRNTVLAHVTKRRVGRRITRAIGLLAAFHGARYAIGIRTLHRGSGDAARSDRPSPASRPGTLSGQAVVAKGLVWGEVARIGSFVAAIGRTRTVVITNDGAAPLASDAHHARLDAVAIQAVVAGLIARNVIAAIVRFIAAIGRAPNVVIAIHGRTRHATEHLVARFHAVAEQVVIAKRVIFDVRTSVCLQVAIIVRACNAVIAIERSSVHAAQRRITRFDAVACFAIAA